MNRLALSFDDGPSKWTPPILDALHTHGAKATFFVLGSHVEEHQKVIHRIVQNGHELGVHGYNHTPVDALSAGQIREHLSATCGFLLKYGATDLRWWRPPWHKVTAEAAEAAEALGLSYCGVTLDSFDVDRTADWIYERVTGQLAPGAIVGLHDGIANNGSQQTLHRNNTVRAVVRLLEDLSPAWEFVTVSELLA